MRRKQTEPPEPLRSCIGCRKRRPQSALVRITRSESGITVDGASAGRGAWLCRASDDRIEANSARLEPACCDAAIKHRAFARAWRGEVSNDQYQKIKEHSGVTDHQTG